MWTTPVTISDDLASMAKQLGCNWIGAIHVKSIPGYKENNCHNNVLTHCAIYGGKRVIGYYFIEGFGTIQAIRHSVWKTDNKLVDITPYADNRDYIIFGISTNNNSDYRISNCYVQSLGKYLHEQEVNTMYYVYQLVDPRDNEPFYIGKGTGNRAKTHLWETPNTRNQYKENKIAAIRQDGFEPKIVYVAENIIDEQLAYDIESQLIKRYGRKGYEKDGILTNVCPDNRPPNHKGKTYEEIYGKEKAKQQRTMRNRLQRERGGYGPKQHSEETKKKISAGVVEAHSNRDCSHSDETKKRIGKANAKYTGKLNKKSKCYKLTSPNGEEFILYGGEAADFCKEHDLSYSTLKMQIQKGWGIPKKGKTKGWKFEEHNQQHT